MLKDIVKTHSPIHTRDIRLATIPHERDSLIVHGELLDFRYVSVVDALDRSKDPSVIHHITVDLLVRSDSLRIDQAEAEMVTVPTDDCQETLDVIAKIIGLHIRPGFSKKVRTLVGGTNGCTHLCTLIKAMGTEAVHGWLSRKRHESPEENMALDALRNFLADSCRLWKKGGTKYREITQSIEEQGSDD